MEIYFDAAHGIDEDDLQFILRINKSMMSSSNSLKLLEFPSPDELALRQEILGKYVLISSVSYFESSIKSDIRSYFGDSFNEDGKFLMNFINKSILDKGFYSLFDWSDSNKGEINAFLKKFFGEGKKFESISTKIKNREDLKWSIKTFYAMIFMRNNVIHKNAHHLPIKHTLEEIIEFYSDSKFFIENFRYILAGDIDSIPVHERSSRFKEIILKSYKENEQESR